MSGRPSPFGFGPIEDEKKDPTVKMEESSSNLFGMSKKYNTANAHAKPVNHFNAFNLGQSSDISKTEPFERQRPAGNSIFTQIAVPANQAPSRSIFGRQPVASQPSTPIASAQTIPKRLLIPKSKIHNPVNATEEGKMNSVSAIAFPRVSKDSRVDLYTMKNSQNPLLKESPTILESPVKEKAITEQAAANSSPKESPSLRNETAGPKTQAFTTISPIGLDPTHTCFVCERPFFDPRQPQQPDTSMWPSVSMTIDAIRSLIVLTIIFWVFWYPDEAYQARNTIVEEMQHAVEDVSRLAGIVFDGMEVWLEKVEAFLSALWLVLSGFLGR